MEQGEAEEPAAAAQAAGLALLLRRCGCGVCARAGGRRPPRARRADALPSRGCRASERPRRRAWRVLADGRGDARRGGGGRGRRRHARRGAGARVGSGGRGKPPECPRARHEARRGERAAGGEGARQGERRRRRRRWRRRRQRPPGRDRGRRAARRLPCARRAAVCHRHRPSARRLRGALRREVRGGTRLAERRGADQAAAGQAGGLRRAPGLAAGPPPPRARHRRRRRRRRRQQRRRRQRLAAARRRVGRARAALRIARSVGAARLDGLLLRHVGDRAARARPQEPRPVAHAALGAPRRRAFSPLLPSRLPLG